MLVFRSLADIPDGFGRTVVSIGNFDGVHCGHRLILEQVRRQAEANGVRSVAVTFDPHPMRVLRPQSGFRLITPIAHRLELLRQTGIDATVVLPFTVSLSGMSASEFATTILHDSLHALEVHEGINFRFGFRAEAGTVELEALGRSLGFELRTYAACQVRGLTVSSSKIRELISQGEMALARALLGHCFSVCSTPARGRGIGSKLTVPTINLAAYPELLPQNGVYVSRIRVGGEWFDSVTNVGNRPTFGGDSFAVESHILDFRPLELTDDTPVELAFLQRIRGEQRWPSPEALKTQIGRDVAHAQRYLHLLQLRSLQLRSLQLRSG